MPRATLEQQREHVPRNRGPEARRPADDFQLVYVADTVHVSPGIEQRADDIHSALTAGGVQRGRVVAHVTRVRIGAMLEQQTDGVYVADREMQSSGALSISLTREARIARQQIAQLREVSFRTGSKECREGRRAACVNLGFQGAPARETVVARHGKLRRRELRARIASA